MAIYKVKYGKDGKVIRSWKLLPNGKFKEITKRKHGRKRD
jgi:hypothetical protein